MIMPQAENSVAGFRPFFNPATGEWITYTALAEDSDGQLVRFTWRSVPGGVITEHIHPRQEERFTILAGRRCGSAAGGTGGSGPSGADATARPSPPARLGSPHQVGPVELVWAAGSGFVGCLAVGGHWPASLAGGPGRRRSGRGCATILAGEAHFTLNGAEVVAGAGETVVVPAGVPHSEGNPGPAEIEGVVELRPALRTKEWHEALAGLVADGKTTPRGAPKNPLQLGATFWHFRNESRVTEPPIWAQNLMLPPLWALAKAFGVRPYYDHWDSRIRGTG